MSGFIQIKHQRLLRTLADIHSTRGEHHRFALNDDYVSMTRPKTFRKSEQSGFEDGKLSTSVRAVDTAPRTAGNLEKVLL